MENEKKKRGRKPKNYLSSYQNNEIDNVTVRNNKNNQNDKNIYEKKKRGRKKKYEIENFEKILNRNYQNNFNHNIVYSDDEEYTKVNGNGNKIPINNDNGNGNDSFTDNTKKSIAFGNLNITISKNKTNFDSSVTTYRNNILEKTRNKVFNTNGNVELIDNLTLINASEYSDEEIPNDTHIHNDIHTPNDTHIHTPNDTHIHTPNDTHIHNHTPTPNPYCIKVNNDDNNNNNKLKKNVVKRVKSFHTLENVVLNGKKWPNSTNVACWWCCHQFNGSPCTLPTKYDQFKKKYNFTGIFCSWNCAKAYNLDKNDYKTFERNELITLLVKQLSSIEDAICIKKAPPRQALQIFGGYMNINQFRSSFSRVDGFHMNLMNYVYIHPEITELTNKSTFK